METGQANRIAAAQETARNIEALSLHGRPLAVAAVIVFFISAAFPVTSGLSKDTASFPGWWGPLDVGIAFVLAILALVLLALAQGHVHAQAHEASYRAYRVLIHGIVVMSAVFILFGDRIVLINCLTGFAWRTWLLLYTLPAWLTAFGATGDRSGLPRRES
jgi:hypothetical protein